MDNTLDILAHTGDAVCAINEEKCVVYWNAAAEEMLDITADEAAGQPCWKLLQGITFDGQPFCSPDCPIQTRIDQQEPIPHFDLQLKNKDSQTVLANFSTIIVPQQNGRHQLEQAVTIHLMRVVRKQAFPQYRLRVNMLGPLTVWRADGSQINGEFWYRAKVRSLFVFLVLKRGEPVKREDIIEALWPELDHATALRSLNKTIYNLRRSLEPELKQGNESHYIFYEDGFYWLGGNQPHRIDVDAFTQGIQQARLETAAAKATQLYEEAIALYGDDYLSDLVAPTGINSSNEQIRLRQLYLSALEELGNLYQQQEQTEQARSIYLKTLALDPHRENAYQQLVRLSHGTDTLQDSVAYCQRLAAALKNELDLILSQDMTRPRRTNKSENS
jgi:two-component SAPR family response regulator